MTKDHSVHFRGKKITVMRIGLIGRGIGDARYMAEAGAHITVVDAATQEIMQPAIDALHGVSNITFKFGQYDFADFKDADFVLVGAGAPLDDPVLMECQKSGVPLKQSAALFMELAQIPLIGVTGTRGKSTTTHMIHHVLSHMTEGGKVLLGGNVRGVSNLQLLSEVDEDSIAVMELDSWQLQGFGWSHKSPQVAVFTTFMTDHMNYYRKGDMSEQEGMDAYFADKAHIFLHQEVGDTLVTSREVFEHAERYMRSQGKEFVQEVELVDSSLLPDDCILSMPGEHNRLNAALALGALRALGLTDEEIFEGLTTFPGVEGRLEFLGTIKEGVKVFNDNNSTTPAAAIMGMRGVGNSDSPNVVLIVGGDDKKIDMSDMVAEIPKWCSKVVMFKERGTDRIRDEVFNLATDTLQVFEEEGLEATVARAVDIAEEGEVILYSPGFSSFGKYFKNEFDRGDQFVALIKKHLA